MKNTKLNWKKALRQSVNELFRFIGKFVFTLKEQVCFGVLLHLLFSITKGHTVKRSILNIFKKICFRNRQTERQIDRQTERLTDRETDRQRNRQTDRQTFFKRFIFDFIFFELARVRHHNLYHLDIRSETCERGSQRLNCWSD